MHYHTDQRDAFVRHLADLFPQTFFVEPKLRRPLKNGILDDLEKLKILDNGKLAQALNWYMTNFTYQYALVAGTERVDLDGKRAGTVTEREQQAALKYIRERKAVVAEQTGRQEIPPQKTVVSVTPTIQPRETAEMPKTITPTLDPVLQDIRSGVDVVADLMNNKTFAPMRATLCTTALRHMIGRAEALIAELTTPSN